MIWRNVGDANWKHVLATMVATIFAVLFISHLNLAVAQTQPKANCEPLYQAEMDALTTAKSQAQSWNDSNDGVSAYYSKSAAYGVAYQNCVTRSK